MLNKIITTMPKIIHQVLVIDSLMQHVNDNELKLKWQFSLNTYDNLLKNVNLYKESSNIDKITINYIINDYETLTQMIDEFKEDIYDKVNPQVFMLLDRMTFEEVNLYKIYTSNICEKYESFNKYITKYLLYELEDIKSYTKKIINYLDFNIELKENKNIPYTKLNNILKLHILEKASLIQIYNIFTSTIKHLDNIDIIKDDYQKLKFDTLITMIGDINV